MEELNLVITSPDESQITKKIVWNRSEFETAIERVVSEYKNVAYTEEMVGQAKKDKATLNKISKAIDDRRKQVKKALMEPYEEFEKELGEAKVQLNEAIANLDGFVKSFEEQERKKRRLTLELYFKKAAFGLEDVISLNDIFDNRWLNASMTTRKAEAEMDAVIDRIKKDLAAISQLDDKDIPTAKNTYYRTHDLGQAMADAARVRRIREEQEKANAETQNVNVSIDKTDSVVENNDIPPQTEKGAHDALLDAAKAVTPNVQVENVAVYRSATFSTKVTSYQMETLIAKTKELGIRIDDLVADIRISGTKESILALNAWMKEYGYQFGSVGTLRGQS